MKDWKFVASRLVVVLLVALVIGLGIGYWILPKEPNVLTDEQVRQRIRKWPCGTDIHLEVKPETIEFLNLSLDFREGKKVWVAEYECEARSIGFYLPEEYDDIPFSPIVIQVVIDAYTGGPISMQYLDLELEFWYESCGASYPHGTCICLLSLVPVKSPQTFKMSTINFYEDREVITLHTYYFGAELDSGAKIVFVINATSPVNLQLVLVNRTDADVLSLGNEVAYYSRVIIEAPKITSYFHELNVQEKGLYIFVFDVAQPKPVATVTFEAEYGS